MGRLQGKSRVWDWEHESTFGSSSRRCKWTCGSGRKERGIVSSHPAKVKPSRHRLSSSTITEGLHKSSQGVGQDIYALALNYRFPR